MPVFTRDNISSLLQQVQNNPPQIFLIFGERYLCQDTTTQLEKILIKPSGTVHSIDGDREDAGTIISKLRSFSLLPGKQIFKVVDTKFFHSKNVSEKLWEKAVKANEKSNQKEATKFLQSFLKAGGFSPHSEDNTLSEVSATEWKKLFGFIKPTTDFLWAEEIIKSLPRKQQSGTTDTSTLLLTCLQEKLPKNNFLLLITDVIDKRKKLYKFFADNFVVIDLSVEAGASTKAKKQQQSVLLSLVQKTLAKSNKTMPTNVTEHFLERVGFHPVAVVMELQKLILYIEEKAHISLADLDAIVGRTKQEALFELTTALTEGKLQDTLIISERLLKNGYHPLALIATIRNTARSLLLFKSLQEQTSYGYSPSLSPQIFQTQCLPKLKQNNTWKKELSGHPYAVFMQFKTAARFNLDRLQEWMSLLLDAELKLKSSQLPQHEILNYLFVRMLTIPTKHVRR